MVEKWDKTIVRFMLLWGTVIFKWFLPSGIQVRMRLGTNLRSRFRISKYRGLEFELCGCLKMLKRPVLFKLHLFNLVMIGADDE